MKFSLEGKLAAALVAGIVVATGVFAAVTHWLGIITLAVAVALVIGITTALLLLHYIMVPVNHLFQALADGVANLRDDDFSISIANSRSDELGRLIDAYNDLGDVLRSERTNILQRELLLDTVIQTTPLALVLTDASDRVIVANTAARDLFNGGRRIQGFEFSGLMAQAPDDAFAQAVARGSDGLFTVDEGDDQQTFHLTTARFYLNTRPHALYLFKQLTREISRQEVATWKKVIRVIAHELNNSLAPISSLANSGRLVATRPDSAKLETIFSTIGERATHLKTFIDGYSRFAKLPQPQPEAVHWPSFVERLRGTVPFQLDGEIPDAQARFDLAQVEQALINLLKNAHESGSAPDEVRVAVIRAAEGYTVRISDRGSGMASHVIKNAMLPFYSTKRSGTGLGLTLCREIVEAHGGRMSLANRDGGGLVIDLSLP